jgi:hypothetical protein
MTIAAKRRKKKALRPRFKLYGFVFLFGIKMNISRRKKERKRVEYSEYYCV